jgi:hypothetical protein
VGGEVEHFGQDRVEFPAILLGQGEMLLGLGEFGLEGALLVGEQVDWQRVGEVGIQQLALVSLDGADAPALASDFVFVVLAHPGDCLIERSPDLIDVGDPLLLGGGADLLELHVGVLADDLGLGAVGGEVGQAAAVAGDPPDAGEVGVDPASFALGLDEGQPRVTELADQAALEEVVVLAVLFPGVVVRLENGLDSGEGVLVDQRFVAAVVLDSAVADGADVVGIGEDASEVRATDRRGGIFAGTAGNEPALLKGCMEGVQGVGAGGVGGKRPRDVRRPVGVRLHELDQHAFDGAVDVAVAQRGGSGGAAESRLLVQAALGVSGEVFGVQLGLGAE